MVSSMRGSDVSDVVDGNVVSKAEDVCDNGGMTREGEVFRGGVEYAGGMKVSRGWRGLLKWHRSLISGTTNSTTTRLTTTSLTNSTRSTTTSPTTSPSPSTSDWLHPNYGG